MLLSLSEAGNHRGHACAAKTIYRLLVYGQKHRGRFLCADIPEFNLEAGDRLEPNVFLQDVAMFEQAPLPLQVAFWRMNLKSDRVLHHSPLLQITGVGPESYFIDILHSWHLGPLGMLLATIVWFLLESPFLSSPFLRGFMTPGELHKLGLLHIRGALMEYYRCRYKTDAQWRKTGAGCGASPWG